MTNLEKESLRLLPVYLIAINLTPHLYDLLFFFLGMHGYMIWYPAVCGIITCHAFQPMCMHSRVASMSPRLILSPGSKAYLAPQKRSISLRDMEVALMSIIVRDVIVKESVPC